MLSGKPIVVVMKGDGIGPEVIDAALEMCPDICNYVDLHFIDASLKKYLQYGYQFSREERRLLDNAKAFFVGAFTTPLKKPKGFNSYVGFLRKTYDLSINMRPFKSLETISKADFDIIIFRQNTEDLYFQNQYFKTPNEAIGEKLVTRRASEIIAKAAFDYAVSNNRKKITIVTKSNVLPLVDGFFKDVTENTITNLINLYNYNLKINHEYVDAAAYKLIKQPEDFDLILTMNMYGDILSDVLAAMMGSLGLCPSANIGKNKGLFEPIHGSAPDIAGLKIANPIGAILALAMLFDWLKFPVPAKELRSSVHKILTMGKKTPDLGGKLTTKEFITLTHK